MSQILSFGLGGLGEGKSRFIVNVRGLKL